MKDWNLVESVQTMHDYIKQNVFEDNFDFEALYKTVSYSKRHANRIFKEYTGKTPTEYIKAIRLSKSSEQLLRKDESILDRALQTNYDSHEGYTRAFFDAFHITPSHYRKEAIHISLFVQYPIRLYYTYLYKKEKLKMSKETLLCTVTVVPRPIRKLIFMRSTKGKDYFSYCEEMGCDWEGLLNSLPNKLDSAAIVTLPEKYTIDGKSNIAAGIEVPADYKGSIPEGYEMIELDACDMLYFQTEPFEEEEDFCVAINSIEKAVQKYKVNAFDNTISPSFNFGASTEMGAKMAIPVRKI